MLTICYALLDPVSRVVPEVFGSHHFSVIFRLNPIHCHIAAQLLQGSLHLTCLPPLCLQDCAFGGLLAFCLQTSPLICRAHGRSRKQANTSLAQTAPA